ncbi:helix-turn-helix domain-containing protein, partial [Sinorhizobium meliloti]|uniref:helix-turn-helix domain-containing protein n=2 Tax=Rhizobium meliloti TaxID=382 RepID=UPI001F359475
MRTGISFTISPSDRARLTALIRSRNAPQKHVWRAEIVLLSADGVGTVEIMRRTGKSKTCVWRWQELFAAEGCDGLLRDKTRPSRIAPLGPEISERVVALTLADPPGETTHWTADMMAAAAGGLSGILCGGPVSSVEEPLAKDDGELCLCLDPFP